MLLALLKVWELQKFKVQHYPLCFQMLNTYVSSDIRNFMIYLNSIRIAKSVYVSLYMLFD